MTSGDSPRISDLARASFARSTMAGDVEEIVRRVIESTVANRDGTVGGWSTPGEPDSFVNRVKEVDLEGYAVEIWGRVDDGKWQVEGRLGYLGDPHRLIGVIASEQHRWLTEPRTTLYFDPAGLPEGAYIEFRTGKTVKTEQPSDTALVFVCLGYDGQPVGVKMIGPAPETVQSSILYRLLASRNGGTGYAVDLPVSFVDSVLHQMGSASAHLRR